MIADAIDFRLRNAPALLLVPIFLLSDAIGHVREMLAEGTSAPVNAGGSFSMDLGCPLLAIALLIAVRRARAERIR